MDAYPLPLSGLPLGSTRKGAVAGEGALFTVGSQRPSEHQPESKVPERQQAEARLLPSRRGAGQPQASPSHTPVGPHGAIHRGPVTGVCHTQGPGHVCVGKRRHLGHAVCLSPGAQPGSRCTAPQGESPTSQPPFSLERSAFSRQTGHSFLQLL